MPHLFRFLLTAIALLFCLIALVPYGFSDSTNDWAQESEVEIAAVVTGAVEDTRWLYVSSRQEMDLLLGVYYTGPLLAELCESAWNFISVPTDWQYVIKAKNCKITPVSRDKASACVDILESDEIAGVTFSSKVEYLLVKTKNGWKISGVEYCQQLY